MNKLVLYDQHDFKGKSKQFVRNMPDLANEMFDNAAQSARVEGHHWVAYTDPNYKGEFIIFAPGDYKTLGCNFCHKLSSLRLVEEELLNPEIDLYEHVDYVGKAQPVTEKVDNLGRGKFNNLVSSHKVKQGVWILHQKADQTGERLITYKGDEWPNYGDKWNDKLTSLRPLVNSYTERLDGSPDAWVRDEHKSVAESRGSSSFLQLLTGDLWSADTSGTMSKIALYDQPNFKGEAKEFLANEPDLSEKLFEDTAKSARVEGQHCIAYTDPNYKGEFIVFGPGEYKTLGCNFNHKLSSLRLVEEELLNPEIDLYEHVDYGGEVREVRKKVDNLQRGNFNNLVSSHKVKRGVWILHEKVDQTGERLITYKGDEWPNYCDKWNDKLTSLRPLVNSYTEVGPTPCVLLQRGQ
ncbi:uncharacterized protein LOC129715260 [Leucoraja erinacea]|uniref:uncharacterized protein LOC129715260 n=1 Tax=Leucoraja erinaceus TaxID=7782 RepID=UPI002455B201|nr:uncharacterized protein LOC129715260 [Leucoraja erinacea]